MLWDSVYSFFVQHIFGGVYNENVYTSSIGIWLDGNPYGSNFGEVKAITLNDIYGESIILDYGSYLSLIATIITMVIIVTLCALFIWKMVKLIGGLIR